MGKNNKERRAAKAKQRARQRAHPGQHARRGPDSWRDTEHPATSGPVFSDVDRAELAWTAAAQIGIGRTSDRDTGLARLGQLPRRLVLATAERLLREHIELLWNNGWQPRELHRQGRIGGRSGAVAQIVELAVASGCTRHLEGSPDLHPQWREQAESVANLRPGTPTGWLERTSAEMLRTEGTAGVYSVIADAMSVVFALPALDLLIPPPGSRVSIDDRRPRSADPMLERVRNLLAKAESTEFEAEAIALTAKAQELITRHAIDAALLSADAGGPVSEPVLARVPIDAPYADAKSLLLQTVATASRCNAVFVTRLSHSNVVGFPDDVAAVEILFTSLLVQAQHGLAEAGRSAPPGTSPRSQGFRSAFLLAYAQRIGERLAEINDHVLGTAIEESGTFLPVLRSQQDAVADFMAERFGETYTSQVRSGYSPSGWSSGRLAADQARLSAGHLGD